MFTVGLIILIMSPWFWIVSPDEAGTIGVFVTAGIGASIMLATLIV